MKKSKAEAHAEDIENSSSEKDDAHEPDRAANDFHHSDVDENLPHTPQKFGSPLKIAKKFSVDR